MLLPISFLSRVELELFTAIFLPVFNPAVCELLLMCIFSSLSAMLFASTVCRNADFVLLLLPAPFTPTPIQLSQFFFYHLPFSLSLFLCCGFLAWKFLLHLLFRYFPIYRSSSRRKKENFCSLHSLTSLTYKKRHIKTSLLIYSRMRERLLTSWTVYIRRWRISV